MAILEIAGLHVTTGNRIMSYFMEDVSKWLDSMNVRGAKYANIRGKSGVSHRIDFLIPGEHMNSPFTAYQSISNPNKQSLATRVLMPMLDISKIRDANFVVIFNDSDMKKSSIEELIAIAESSGIESIRWSLRNESIKS